VLQKIFQLISKPLSNEKKEKLNSIAKSKKSINKLMKEKLRRRISSKALMN